MGNGCGSVDLCSCTCVQVEVPTGIGYGSGGVRSCAPWRGQFGELALELDGRMCQVWSTTCRSCARGRVACDSNLVYLEF